MPKSGGAKARVTINLFGMERGELAATLRETRHRGEAWIETHPLPANRKPYKARNLGLRRHGCQVLFDANIGILNKGLF